MIGIKNRSTGDYDFVFTDDQKVYLTGRYLRNDNNVRSGVTNLTHELIRDVIGVTGTPHQNTPKTATKYQIRMALKGLNKLALVKGFLADEVNTPEDTIEYWTQSEVLDIDSTHVDFIVAAAGFGDPEKETLFKAAVLIN